MGEGQPRPRGRAPEGWQMTMKSDSPLLQAGRFQAQLQRISDSTRNARLRLGAAQAEIRQASAQRTQALEDQAKGKDGAERLLADTTARLQAAHQAEAEAKEQIEAAASARVATNQELTQLQAEHWDVFREWAQSAVEDYERSRERFLAAEAEMRERWQQAAAHWRSFERATVEHFAGVVSPLNAVSASRYCALPEYPLNASEYVVTGATAIANTRERLPQPNFLDDDRIRELREYEDEVKITPLKDPDIETVPR